MHKITFYFALLFFTLLLSCQDPYEYKTKIIGTWETVDWTIASTGQKRSNKMNFIFKADKRYTVDYGIEKEEGKWWIESGNELFTNEDGGQLKKVKILSIDGEDFAFEMNRAGEIETVKLKKR